MLSPNSSSTTPFTGFSGSVRNSARTIVRIRSAAPSQVLDFGELWAFRDLFRMLVWRELHLRYHHTLVGIGWVFLQPALTVLVFGLIAPHLRGGASSLHGIPYPVFAYAALAPWMYFIHALTRANSSLADHAAFVGNVYFPRIFLPAAAVVAGLADLLVLCGSLIVLMLGYGTAASQAIWAAPLFLLLAVGSAFGVGLWASVVQVEYRDVSFITQFALQLGFVALPIGYSAPIAHEPWRTLSGLNPVFTAIVGFRWAVLGIDPPAPSAILLSICILTLLIASGVWFFRRKEGYVTDVA